MNVKRWILASLVYLIIVLALIAIKPAFLFTKDGSVKQWGIGTEEGKSVFGVQFLFPLIALLCYYFITLIMFIV